MLFPSWHRSVVFFSTHMGGCWENLHFGVLCQIDSRVNMGSKQVVGSHKHFIIKLGFQGPPLFCLCS